MSPYVRDGDLCIFYRLDKIYLNDVVLYENKEGKKQVAPINAATIDANAGQTNVTSITTDAKGKATQKFYLQHGQQVTVQGIAKDTTYALTENTEDYKSTANTAAKSVVTIKEGTDSAEVNGTIASTDLTTGYLNTRKGVIPTGVIMTVAPFAAVTLLGAAGMVTIKMKKREDDEE